MRALSDRSQAPIARPTARAGLPRVPAGQEKGAIARKTALPGLRRQASAPDRRLQGCQAGRFDGSPFRRVLQGRPAAKAESPTSSPSTAAPMPVRPPGGRHA
jgi:hypothetical protein